MNKVITITGHETRKAGEKTIHVLFEDNTKFEFWELKKDNSPTKAHQQFKELQLGVGSVCNIEYDEKEEQFTNKDGKDIKFKRRTIKYFITDDSLAGKYIDSTEKRVPVDAEYPPRDESKPKTLEERVQDLENWVTQQ